MIRFRTTVWSGALALGVLALTFSAPVQAGCRIGFDVGSSGVRVGAADSAAQARVSIDYLADVWTDNRIDTSVEPTIAAFSSLPAEAGLPGGCDAVAGGYSAWRLAMERGNPAEVAETLRLIRARTGVALYVIPQDVEGTYGFYAARQSLGSRLRDPYILDVGGGSMQIASIHTGWGAALGQKAWRKMYCQDGKGSSVAACTVNPVGPDAISLARKLLGKTVASARAAVGPLTEATAVSAPLVKTMHPVIRHLAAQGRIPAGGVTATSFDVAALKAAIRVLSDKDDAALLRYLDDCPQLDGQAICAPSFLPTLVSDMLLVHAFMEGLGIRRLELAEANITNVPGLLADTRAWAWRDRFDCYLSRLAQQGDRAFKSDPATCPR